VPNRPVRRITPVGRVIEGSESAGGGRAAGGRAAAGADQGDRGRRLELTGMAFVIHFPSFFESQQP